MDDDDRLTSTAKHQIRRYMFRIFIPPAIVFSIASFLGGLLFEKVVYQDAYTAAYQNTYEKANDRILDFAESAGRAKADAESANELVRSLSGTTSGLRQRVEALPAFANWEKRFEELKSTILSDKGFVESVQDLSNLVVCAGSVSQNGDLLHTSGTLVSVKRLLKGRYELTFQPPFDYVPILVATSDGGDSGAFAEVVSAESSGFIVEGRSYATHSRSDIGFQFAAFRSRK
jgi:hypothetical protein